MLKLSLGSGEALEQRNSQRIITENEDPGHRVTLERQPSPMTSKSASGGMDCQQAWATPALSTIRTP